MHSAGSGQTQGEPQGDLKPVQSRFRVGTEVRFEMLRMAVALTIGFLVTALIVVLTSDQPGESLRCLFLGPLERARYIFNVVELMLPLMFTGVAVCICFSAKQFNLASEGTFFFGGMVAAVAAITLTLPKGIHAAVCIALAGLSGGVIGAIPGILKHKWRASELVLSLMLNYVCYSTSMYVIRHHFRDVYAGAIVSHLFQKTAVMTKLQPPQRLTTWGVILVLAVCAIAYLFLYKTRWGFTIRATGENVQFAGYTGLNVGFAVIGSQAIAGMVAGMGGAVEMLSMFTRFQWTTLTGFGWDGLIVAIFARNNPKYVPFSAAFLAYLRIGADIMLRRTGVQMEIVKVIQAILIVLLVAESFLAKTHHRMVVREATSTATGSGEVA